ncbi:MAG: hypothetical protein ACXWEF_01195, partial [Solirubrobacterales bacterium]
MSKSRGRGVGFAAVFVVGFGLCAAQASAACPAGTCHVTISANTGAGSLREAVDTLSANGDTIIIDAPIDPTLSAQILINKSITIQGAGAGTTEISNPGSTTGRVFNIGSTTPGAVVTLSAMTIKDGNAPSGPPGLGATGQFGGGIRNSATLTLNGVAVTGNTAGDGSLGSNGGNGTGGGAGDPGDPGALGGDGGGVYNDGTLTITNSTIADNKAGDGGNGGDGGDGGATGDGADAGDGGIGGFGGGVLNLGLMSVTTSTFSNNQSGAGGTGGDGG